MIQLSNLNSVMEARYHFKNMASVKNMMSSVKTKLALLSMIIILCLNQCSVKETNIQPIERYVGKLHISIDPRMEILTTIQLLANYPFVNEDLPYSEDIVNYFKSFSSHEAVLMTDSLLQKHRFAFDAPVNFMLHLSQLPKLERDIEFSNYVLMRSGRDDNLEEYRKHIQHFAGISNFEAFWNSKISYYNQILDLAIAELGELDLVKVLEDYFNEPKDDFKVIISPSFIGGFGPTITDANGNDVVYACIPFFTGIRLPLFTWHEFGHSFVNPLSDKYFDKVKSMNNLFEPIKENMTKQAYGEWQTCVNEHVIRAVVVRLVELHYDTQFSKFLLEEMQLETKPSAFLLENELMQGFIYIKPLFEKLKNFETQRDENNITFTDYYPELLNALDNIQP